MEREVIFAEDAEKIFGKRPWASRSEEILEPIEQKAARPAVPSELPESAESTEDSADPKLTDTPVVAETPEQSTITEAPDYTQPKSERPRKRKIEGLFEGFDFDQDDQTEK